VVASRRRVEAAAAGPREAHLLGIRRGDPLLVLRSIGYTTGRRPLDYFIAFHRGDKSAFEIELGSSADGGPGRFERVPVAQAGPDP
jgi:GntR family transcriptional regulator